MNKIRLIQALIFLSCTYSFAQLGVGTTSPNTSAQLEVISVNKGILIPQLALTSNVDSSTITNGNVESLLVYNITNASGLTPGYYYWSNSKWNRLATTENGSAVDVDNNLTSTSTENALSAYQGLVLKALVDVNTAKTGITTVQAADIMDTKAGVDSNTAAIENNTVEIEDVKVGVNANATEIAANKTDLAANITTLATKVDKVSGKELSANDFTDLLKTKLDGLDNTTVTDNLTSTSTTNALSANQGKVLKDLVDVNTAKTGITTTQAADIAANKTGVAANVTTLATKVDKVTGKELSANDFTDVLKTKLDGLDNTTVTDNLTSTSTTNALSVNQGKVLKDLVDVNTAKTGITTTQAADIAANKTDVAANVTTLATKVDKVTGKELSANDFTDVLKTKLDGLDNTTVTDNLTSTSTTNALSVNQGKVLKDLVDVNTAKTGITTIQAADIAANKTGVAANVTTLASKVDKVTGKELSANDFTDVLKTKLDGLDNTTVTDNLTSTSTTNALSANQGKELEDAKLNKTLTDANVFIGNASNIAAAQTLNGDATLANDGALTIEDDAVDGTDIKITSEAAGSLMYNDGTDWQNLAAGSAGQSLVMNTGATAPEWKTNSNTSTTLARLLVPMGSDYITVSANSAYQTVKFGAATKDTESGWDNANDKYTVAKAGDYWIDFNASWVNNGGTTSDIISIMVRINGTTKLKVRHNLSDISNTSRPFIQGISGMLNDLSINDEITIELYDSDDVILIMGGYSYFSLMQLPTTAGVGDGGGTGTGSSDYESLTDTDVTGVATGAVNYFDGTNWVDLPAGSAGQSLVMNTGADAPEWQSGGATEDVRDVLYTSGSALLSNNGTGTIPFNWGDLANQGYESVMFEAWENLASNSRSQSVTISVESFIGEADKYINLYDNTTTYTWFRNIDASGNSFTLYCSSSSFKVRIYGIKAQKTVIDVLNTPTNDQATSGYMDIGNMRIQWGTISSAGDGTLITFPETFADNSYGLSIITGGNAVNASYSTATPTSVTIGLNHVGSGSTSTNIPCEVKWQATGIKP